MRYEKRIEPQRRATLEFSRGSCLLTFLLIVFVNTPPSHTPRIAIAGAHGLI